MDTDNQQERLLGKKRYLHYYIAGFVDGEGSFNVSMKPHSKMRFGWVVDPEFQVYQHKNNFRILKIIENVFKCGCIKPKSPTSNVMVFKVMNRRSLLEKVVPFFDRYPLLSIKQEDFQRFKEILLIMKEKKHLELEGLKKIVEIACSMNAQGKQRKYSKEYILNCLTESSETIRQIPINIGKDIVRSS